MDECLARHRHIVSKNWGGWTCFYLLGQKHHLHVSLITTKDLIYSPEPVWPSSVRLVIFVRWTSTIFVFFQLELVVCELAVMVKSHTWSRWRLCSYYDVNYSCPITKVTKGPKILACVVLYFTCSCMRCFIYLFIYLFIFVIHFMYIIYLLSQVLVHFVFILNIRLVSQRFLCL